MPKKAENLVRTGSPIYVTVPASAAFSLEKMNKITKTVLGKLGCEGCHSGFDIRFLTESRFVFNERLEIMNETQFK